MQAGGTLTTTSVPDEKLVIAASKGDIVSDRNALNRGARIDSKIHDGATALIIAASENNLEMVAFLIENDATIEVKDSDGDSALSWAVSKDNPEMARLLIEKLSSMRIDTIVRKHVNQKVYGKPLEPKSEEMRKILAPYLEN
jgi:ankyrin repeat protein